jgi:hypothetical protein
LTRRSQLRIVCILAFVFLASPLGWRGVQAQDSTNNASAPLPLAMDEYEAFVERLATELKGNEAAMGAKLHALGFSCTLVDKSIQFECVRFGCQKRGIFPGSLLQWTVRKSSLKSKTATFSGSAMSYGWLRGCIPMNELQEEQQRFLSRNG